MVRLCLSTFRLVANSRVSLSHRQRRTKRMHGTTEVKRESKSRSESNHFRAHPSSGRLPPRPTVQTASLSVLMGEIAPCGYNINVRHINSPTLLDWDAYILVCCRLYTRVQVAPHKFFCHSVGWIPFTSFDCYRSATAWRHISARNTVCP